MTMVKIRWQQWKNKTYICTDNLLCSCICRFGKTDIPIPTYNSTVIDISLYPRLWDGAALEVFGAGDYATHFTTWGPTPDGPMLLLTSSKTMATMSWSLHGMHFDGCSVDYALAINAETPVSNPGPRAEHNNFKLFDVTFVRGVGLSEGRALYIYAVVGNR